MSYAAAPLAGPRTRLASNTPPVPCTVYMYCQHCNAHCTASRIAEETDKAKTRQAASAVLYEVWLGRRPGSCAADQRLAPIQIPRSAPAAQLLRRCCLVNVCSPLPRLLCVFDRSCPYHGRCGGPQHLRRRGWLLAPVRKSTGIMPRWLSIEAWFGGPQSRVLGPISAAVWVPSPRYSSLSHAGVPTIRDALGYCPVGV